MLFCGAPHCAAGGNWHKYAGGEGLVRYWWLGWRHPHAEGLRLAQAGACHVHGVAPLQPLPGGSGQGQRGVCVHRGQRAARPRGQRRGIIAASALGLRDVWHRLTGQPSSQLQVAAGASAKICPVLFVRRPLLRVQLHCSMGTGIADGTHVACACTANAVVDDDDCQCSCVAYACMFGQLLQVGTRLGALLWVARSVVWCCCCMIC
ncbi:hypothetical protein COO60DRAFT_1053575 [Scenedesmus sp. NREL 46B-D3]|nr:hypothetical protein COO60DRAFT_1053575 [Scenedesmus sp. NREL 46B-D3]